MARGALYTFQSWRTRIPLGLALLCFIGAAALVGYKVLYRGYRFVRIETEASWIVRLVLDIEATGQHVVVRAMTPEPVTARQRITDLETIGEGFRVEQEGAYMTWRCPAMRGKARLVMKYRAQTSAKKYALPAFLDWEDVQTTGLKKYLQPTPRIQSRHPDIRAKAELLRAASDDVMSFIEALFQYVQDDVVYRRVGGPTDAVTAYRLGEASCNGKNRLLVALARSQSIPARLVKGIILEKGVVKKQSHSWSELFIDGQWIPFCPTGRYYARIPASYLEYPKMDERMFKYTKNIKFERAFHINRGARTAMEALTEDLDNPHHLLRAWGSLGKAQFSLSLLMVILTIPVGATLVSFVRNVVGLVPFGTFLPTLIAVSFRDTGLGWGMLMFCGTLLVGVGANEVLRRFHLLHFPRLSIVLTVVVACILGLALLALGHDNVPAAKVGMFPLAIMTLTIERFSLVAERDTLRASFTRLAVTLAVAAGCYVVMMDFRVRSAMLVFPELLLVCVGINLLLGAYTGLRWTEYIRFHLLKSAEERR